MSTNEMLKIMEAEEDRIILEKELTGKIFHFRIVDVRLRYETDIEIEAECIETGQHYILKKEN